MSERETLQVYIFMGPPGSGKGSLSALCTRELGWAQLSTGNLCRAHVTAQTDIGRQIDFSIKSGKLIPDSLISSMVEQWFIQTSALSSHMIMDGYPRTKGQANSFTTFVSQKNAKLTTVLLDVPDQEVLDRMVSRIVCDNKKCQSVYSAITDSPLAPVTPGICDRCGSTLVRRKDDQELVIRDRLVVYRTHAAELIEYYNKNSNSVIHLDARQSVERVFDQFKRSVGMKI